MRRRRRRRRRGRRRNSERGERCARPRDEEEGRVRRCFVPPRNTSWCLVEGSGGGREDPNFLVFNHGLCMLFNSGCQGDGH